MSSNLLFVPYRKTQKVQFGKQLRDIISKEYYQTASAFESDIQEVDTLRNDTIDLQVSVQDLALLKRYYIHLTTLESKFPKDVVEFPWFGTLGYHATGPVKLKSFLFERVNVLYNIAALYTQLAVNQDRKTDEGLKKACLHFQYAATYFQYINTLGENDTSITLPLDLQKGAIDTLSYISLAQAQEVFWQKAFVDKVKDSLIARLAAQVSDYYDKALINIDKTDGFRTEWNHHLTVKKFHFAAAAEYRASLVAVSNSKYGEEVGRLQKASKLLQSVGPSLKFVSLSVKEDFKGLESVISETLSRSEKDNDLIYLQDVPSEVSPIVKAPVTKDMNIDEIKNPMSAIASGDYGALLFKDLLPFYVIQTAEAFRERQEEYVNKHIVVPTKALSQMLTRFLHERNLPASLDSVDKPQSLPAGLLDHHQSVKAQGGVKKLSQILYDVERLSLEAEHLIQGAKERLEVEKKEDELLRAKQGSAHWTRPKSDEAASALHQRVKELENYLEQAKNGDKVIKKEFLDIEEPLGILSSSVAQIQQYIPNSRTRELDPSLRRVISQLKDRLAESRKLEIERSTFIDTVLIKSSQYNILPKIISEYKAIQANVKNVTPDSSIFEPVFTKHIKNFSGDLEWLETQKKKQQDLEDKIDELNKQFILLNDAQGSNHEREKVLKTLSTAYVRFTELVSNLSQGLKFYNDFNSNCQSLIQDIDSFVYERRTQARDLEVELNSRFKEMNLNDENKRTTQVKRVPVRTPSPALAAPKAQQPKSKFGVWNPENGIKFD